MYLTKSNTFIIGWIAALLGLIMNGIYTFQYGIGLENIGLCIILFTFVIYLLMTPLTIQQQKFSKLSVKMNPEIQAIQKKYEKKKNDQAAMMKMNEETQAVYAKYGVNPMGSCVQLLIQMPILFALYQVIYRVPAYVTKVREAFMPLAQSLMTASGAEEFLSSSASSLNVSFKEMTNLTIIDVLYKFKSSNWTELAAQFPDLSDTISTTRAQADKMNYFLGMNIAESPVNIISSSFKAGAFLLVIAAILIPVLAALSQWISAKLMSNTQDSDTAASSDNTMAQSMKTMNTVMPLMSAVFCFTLPVGMGLYWIAGAVIRTVQQVLINKKLNKMDIDKLASENTEKMNKKMEKRREKEGITSQKMTSNATINTRKIDAAPKSLRAVPRADLKNSSSNETNQSSREHPVYKEGSLAAKANMVREYNERNTKK